MQNVVAIFYSVSAVHEHLITSLQRKLEFRIADYALIAISF